MSSGLKKLLLVLFSVFQATFLGSQTTFPLRFQGNVSGERMDLGNATIQITQNGKVVQTVATDGGGNYSFEVPMGGDFLVTVSKEGYVPKKFTISTLDVPPEKAETKWPLIEASLTLFKRLEGIDYSLLNQPLNKYTYNIAKDNFEYDKKYLEQMLNGIEAIKEAEKVVKNKERDKDASYVAAVKAGDKAFNLKDYNNAISSYQEALKIKPGESYPGGQITIINKLKADADAQAKAEAAAKKKA